MSSSFIIIIVCLTFTICRDARDIIKVIVSSVDYLHDLGIVHRDLKPENLLYRSKDSTLDLCVADFGLSRVMEHGKFQQLYTICGTVGYMAPEVFTKSGHSFPVDLWALGVITYFLLSGHTPFDRSSQKDEIASIIKGEYKFEPKEYWDAVSDVAKDFVKRCLTVDPSSRITAKEALKHPWLEGVADKDEDLLPNVRKAFNARKSFRAAVRSVQWINRLKTIDSSDEDKEEYRRQVRALQLEAEKENVGPHSKVTIG